MRGRLRRLTLLAAVLLVSVFAGSVVAGPERSDIKVVAEFTDAASILAGNDVQVNGVTAGRVDKVTLDHGVARLTLEIDAAFTPIHTDASAVIRPVSLLGERFVDLDQGTPSAPVLPDGGVIPASRNRRSVELQELADVIDQPTGRAMAALNLALGQGMAGRGEDAAAALAALEPVMTDTARLLEVLDGQNQLLAAMVDRVEPVAGAMAAERGERLDRLVGAADRLLGATAASRVQLDEGLRRLPAALASARSALAELANLAGQTTPVLASLRPMTGNLSAIADELAAFADAAGPALATLDPVLARTRELIDAARPVASQLAAAGGDMESVARSSRTLAEPQPEDMSNLLDAIRNISLATAGADGISHYLRIFVVNGSQAIDGLLPAPPAAAPALSSAAPRALAPPPAGLVRPPVDVARGPRVPGLADLRPPVLPGLSGGAEGDSATGLTYDQERALLDYLVGGR
jgi:phospholipid/cholesterol/gamma-HCH transport system substrate-binding protein